MIVKGIKAKKLLFQLSDSTENQKQLMLAKITGNFKRGNER